MSFSLEGKNAIVTGGAGGLGAGMAEGLRDAGASVVVLDIAEAAGESEGITHRVADLSDREGLPALVREVEAAAGPTDILVNNAGMQFRSPVEDFPLDAWDRVIELNLTSVFLLMQEVGRGMIDRGSGKIINVASLMSFQGGLTIPAYAASKGGIAQLTKSFANEWASKGVNVNAIAPGYMDTPLNVALVGNPDREPDIMARIPARRWGQPSDLAGVAVFLSSPMSDYIHGAVIPVDGGYLSR